MPFGIVVNGVSIPDHKVIAIHDMKAYVSPAVVASKLGMLKSQVVEVRTRLREGLAEDVERIKRGNFAQRAAKKSTATPAGKATPDRQTEPAKSVTELQVLTVIAKASARAFMKEVVKATGTNNRAHISDLLKSLRDKKRVEYRHPGTYSPTLAGLAYLREHAPDCRPHPNAVKRAGVHEKNQPEKAAATPEAPPNKPEPAPQATPAKVLSEDEIKALYAVTIPPMENAGSELAQSALADLDEVFARQAVAKLTMQLELLEKSYHLLGKLSQDINGSITELKTFMEG